jgi:hypothetical protein
MCTHIHTRYTFVHTRVYTCKHTHTHTHTITQDDLEAMDLDQDTYGSPPGYTYTKPSVSRTQTSTTRTQPKQNAPEKSGYYTADNRQSLHTKDAGTQSDRTDRTEKSGFYTDNMHSVYTKDTRAQSDRIVTEKSAYYTDNARSPRTRMQPNKIVTEKTSPTEDATTQSLHSKYRGWYAKEHASTSNSEPRGTSVGPDGIGLNDRVYGDLGDARARDHDDGQNPRFKTSVLNSDGGHYDDDDRYAGYDDRYYDGYGDAHDGYYGYEPDNDDYKRTAADRYRDDDGYERDVDEDRYDRYDNDGYDGYYDEDGQKSGYGDDYDSRYASDDQHNNGSERAYSSRTGGRNAPKQGPNRDQKPDLKQARSTGDERQNTGQNTGQNFGGVKLEPMRKIDDESLEDAVQRLRESKMKASEREGPKAPEGAGMCLFVCYACVFFVCVFVCVCACCFIRG